jgi:Mn2+/Fe2+ NRAMP family transporter
MARAKKKNWRGFLLALGPGIIWASASIGVSHLVQSTRAGAGYGFALAGIVVLALVVKYPFFEYGPRYAAATGESLLEGYRRVGNWTLPVFLLLTLLTMFTIQAGVTIVMAGLAANLIGVELSVTAWSAILLGTICLLLVLGQYPWLDRIMKVLIVLLAAATLTAGLIAFGHGPRAPLAHQTPPIWSATGITFMVALMGWMPSAIEISVWHSLWTLERRRQTKHAPSLREALFDFNLGYGLTAFYAFVFLSLGALLMFGTGEKFSSSAIEFTAQLIRLYTATLGDWTWPIIATAAFATMFSTTLAVTDAYPRTWRRAIEIMYPQAKRLHNALYWGILFIVACGGLIIIAFFVGNLKALIDLATILSFLSAPIYGFMNYRAVTLPSVPKRARPPMWMRRLSLFGLAFLTVFGLLFLSWRFE